MNKFSVAILLLFWTCTGLLGTAPVIEDAVACDRIRIPIIEKLKAIGLLHINHGTDSVTTNRWVAGPSLGTLRITVYGPARNGSGGFPLTNYVSRWIGRTSDVKGFTVADALQWADELGLDGICASSPGRTHLYQRHRDEMPPAVEIEGRGRYLVVDHMADYLTDRLDIWVCDPWPGGTYFSENREVWEITAND